MEFHRYGLETEPVFNEPSPSRIAKFLVSRERQIHRTRLALADPKCTRCEPRGAVPKPVVSEHNHARSSFPVPRHSLFSPSALPVYLTSTSRSLPCHPRCACIPNLKEEREPGCKRVAMTHRDWLRITRRSTREPPERSMSISSG